MNVEASIARIGRRKVVRLDVTLDLARAWLDDLSQMQQAKPRWKMLREALRHAEDLRLEGVINATPQED